MRTAFSDQHAQKPRQCDDARADGTPENRLAAKKACSRAAVRATAGACHAARLVHKLLCGNAAAVHGVVAHDEDRLLKKISVR